MAGVDNASQSETDMDVCNEALSPGPDRVKMEPKALNFIGLHHDSPGGPTMGGIQCLESQASPSGLSRSPCASSPGSLSSPNAAGSVVASPGPGAAVVSDVGSPSPSWAMIPKAEESGCSQAFIDLIQDDIVKAHLLF